MNNEDIRDAAFFRLWIRLITHGAAARVAAALAKCISEADYRNALAKIAHEEGINLPPRLRTLDDLCPYPDKPGWTMVDCWDAKRCACADGVRLGYKPTTKPIAETA